MLSETTFTKFIQLYNSLGLSDYQNKFVKDGIIDPELFSEQKIKILFIAKEHNHLGNPNANIHDDDYRIWWQNRVHLQFAHRISEWAYGILNGFKFGNNQLNENQKRLALRSIAFINVKKTSGNSKANLDVICQYIENSRELLYEQIRSISPNIIICCFRQDFLVGKLFPEVKIKRAESGLYSYLRWYHDSKSIPIINFYHPSCRKGKLFLYEQLQTAVEHVVPELIIADV